MATLQGALPRRPRSLTSLTPAQNVVKVVLAELTELLGSTESKLTLMPNRTPNVIMLVGLQGSGKTTASRQACLPAQEAGPLSAARRVRRAPSRRGRPARDRLVARSACRSTAVTARIPVAIARRGRPGGRRPPPRRGHRRHRRSPADRRADDAGGRATSRSAVKPDQVLMVVDAMTGQDIVNVVSDLRRAHRLRRRDHLQARRRRPWRRRAFRRAR